MKKKYFSVIFTILIIAILVSGARCPVNRGNVDAEKEAEQAMKYGTDIYEGNDGLVIEFVKDVPPKRVYSGDAMTIAFDIYNMGAKSTEANDAYLYLSGADPNILKLNSQKIALDAIPGKGEVLGEGGFTTETFETSGPVNIPTGTDVYRPKLIGTVCYNYETTASPVVCMDPNPFGTFSGDRACDIRDVSTTGGQGAPVAVTKIEQLPMKGSTQLKIYVKNVGKGKVIHSDKLQTCTQVGAQDYNYINKLDWYTVTIGGTDLSDCKPASVRLTNNEGIIICKHTFSDSNIQAFTTPVTIKLGYSYIESTNPYEVEIMNIEPVVG